MTALIYTAIRDALHALGLTDISFVVDHPTDAHTGADYFSNVALAAAKAAGVAPRVIAEKIIAALDGRIPNVSRIDVAGPGFLNFYLTREFYKNSIATAHEQAEQWGRNTQHSGQTVLVEYTSPNLFKPLHIGNLVGNIIGEAITRLFEANGATVNRINYPSDIGLTVAKAVWGLKETGADPTDISALGEAYRFGSESYENSEEVKAAVVAINQALYAGTDDSLMALRAAGIATSKAKLDAICKRLGTSFDTVIFESDAADTGVSLVREHTGTVFEESDGAIVYRGEKVGLHTRVFLNSKGLPTYEAKDLGNFVIKQRKYPNWQTSIIVTGNEQTEYFKVLYASINELFPDTKHKSLEHIPTGFLTLTTGKMSSRKGNVLTGESLLADMEEAAYTKAAETRTNDIAALTDMVAVAALKYQILRQATGTNIVFDKERALSFEGDSGPYLQYTHARIVSVLERAATSGVLPETHHAPAVPYQIEQLIYQFPEVITSALTHRSPHQVTHYLTELAGAFNAFYATEKIADATDEYAPYKAAIADVVRTTLKNGLWVLGISAPEQM